MPDATALPARLPAAAVALALGLTLPAASVWACGCLSPPIPDEATEFAVNQQSEQIIFEVEPDGYVTAHVLIRYAGAPEEFAWIVPTPNVPELALSEEAVFAQIDRATSPLVSVRQSDLCPSPEYRCAYHPPPHCPSQGIDAGSVEDAGGWNSPQDASSGSADTSPSPNPGGVEVIDRLMVGSYETIIFGADEASGAVEWLRSEGFIVNDTMAPYMQPYLDAQMVFVASRLVAGAGIDAIKPLRMRFRADHPMIPLQLTAVAAEPHLTVTAYVFSDAEVAPVDHPLVGLDPRWISEDGAGRSNYPMALARAVDDAGGDGFLMEFSGRPRLPAPNAYEPCCDPFDGDFCGVGLDGVCQCPGADFDRDDCAAEEGLLDAVALLDHLSGYPHMTRLTTRLSPEEMTFDPMFAPASSPSPLTGHLNLTGQRRVMNRCEDDIIDRGLYTATVAAQSCASLYCGHGQCAVTSEGAGCRCDDGFVARSFRDLDGSPSVTCVPEVGTVDLSAGGLELPDACADVACGDGACVEIGGFPTCRCAPEAAAVTSGVRAPTCAPISFTTSSPGARDFSAPLDAVRACAPRPPECGPEGWLEPNTSKQRQGVLCPSSIPDPEAFEVPPPPTCGDGAPDADPRTPRDPSDPWGDPVDAGHTANPGADTSRPAATPAASGDDASGCSTAPGHPSDAAALLLLAIALIARR